MTAKDPFGETDTTMVTIRVLERERKAPDFMPKLTPKIKCTLQEYDENGTGPVATFAATDPEGAGIDWSLGEGLDDELLLDRRHQRRAHVQEVSQLRGADGQRTNGCR